MKKTTLLFFYLTIVLIINAQKPLQWAKQFDGTQGASNSGNSVAIDASGNIYTIGTFQGITDFDPGTGVSNSHQYTVRGKNIFISKTTASGSFLWSKQFFTSQAFSGADFVGTSIALDKAGNIYTTGYFSGAGDFDPGSGVFNLTTNGNSAMFILKLDANGNFQWAKSIDGGLMDARTSIAVDSTGSAITTGYFYGTVDFDPGAGNFNLTSTAKDIFILKLDPAGNFIWAKSIGGSLDDAGKSVTVDKVGNIYATGSFIGTVDFDPGVGVYNLSPSNSFVLKLDPSGNFVWAKGTGGQETSVAVDANANVFTTGYFQGTIDFDPGVGVYDLVSGSDDIFISKLDANGNFVWAKKLAGVGKGKCIKLDAAANCYTTGSFSGTVDFDPDNFLHYDLTAQGSTDIFISKLDSNGNFKSAKAVGGIGADVGNSIAIDVSGKLYITGSFSKRVDFNSDPVDSLILNTIGDNDVFILKTDNSGNFQWAENIGGRVSLAGEGMSVAVDKLGNTYTAGYFEGVADFDPGIGVYNLSSQYYPSTSQYAPGTYISKLDRQGNFVWAKKIENPYFVNYPNLTISLDALDNVYLNGSFFGTVDFDPDTGVFNLSATYKSIYILKLNSSGNFVWAKKIANPNNDGSIAEANSVSFDSLGSIFITGLFFGLIDFDPGVGIYNMTSLGYDLFVVKLDAAGNFVWAKQVGATTTGGNSIPTSAVSDLAGNIYIAGGMSGNVDFDPSPTTSSFLTGTGNAYILKLDASGNFVWVKEVYYLNSVPSVAIDKSGNLYYQGDFKWNFDLDPGSGVFNLATNNTNLDYEMYILKLDAAGNFVWAKNFGGANSEPRGTKIVANAKGEIYSTGIMYGTVDFDPNQGVANLYYSTSLNSFNPYILKLDGAGNYIWAKNFEGGIVLNSITVDKSDNLYGTGQFWQIADFDPGLGSYNLDAINSNAFVFKLGDNVAGIEENTYENKGVFIYPNPTNSNLYLKNTDMNEYEILNIVGQSIQKGKVEDNSISTQDLVSGVYLLHLSDKTGSAVLKFIKE